MSIKVLFVWMYSTVHLGCRTSNELRYDTTLQRTVLVRVCIEVVCAYIR